MGDVVVVVVVVVVGGLVAPHPSALNKSQFELEDPPSSTITSSQQTHKTATVTFQIINRQKHLYMI